MNLTQMDISSLSEAREKAARQHDASLEESYEQAIANLRRSAAGGFDDKQALQASLEGFHRMIAQDPEDARPYTYIAYLCYLMDRSEDAEAYLQQARKLNPDEPDSEALADLLHQDRSKVRFTSWDPELPAADQQIDTEALYAELSAHVQARLRQLAALPAGRQPDKQELGEIRAALADLPPFLSLCDEALGLLAASIPADTLASLMQPLRRRHEQLSAVAAEAARLQNLQRRLSEATRNAERLSKLVRKLRGAEAIAGFAAELELCYDACDAIADSLDALSNEGHDVSRSQVRYEFLLRFVTQLQEAFEPLQRTQQR